MKYIHTKLITLLLYIINSFRQPIFVNTIEYSFIENLCNEIDPLINHYTISNYNARMIEIRSALNSSTIITTTLGMIEFVLRESNNVDVVNNVMKDFKIKLSKIEPISCYEFLEDNNGELISISVFLKDTHYKLNKINTYILSRYKNPQIKDTIHYFITPLLSEISTISKCLAEHADIQTFVNDENNHY